jgi:uncharacterized membrane protein
MVTVQLHQTIRGMTPVFTVAIYRFFFHNTYSNAVYCSLIPVIAGVTLATYGDYNATLAGFFWTVVGASTASMKTVATNRLQTAGLHMGAEELLYRMSSLALLQACIMAFLTGEWTSFTALHNSGQISIRDYIYLFINGGTAYLLSIVSFNTNRQVGALTISVVGNIKQVLTILLSCLFWRLEIGWMNACGIALAIFGGAVYGHISMRKKLPKDTEVASEVK